MQHDTKAAIVKLKAGLKALDRLTRAHFEALERLAAEKDKALSAAFAASEKAIEKAGAAQQRVNESQNEFRQALSDAGKEAEKRLGIFVQRPQFDDLEHRVGRGETGMTPLAAHNVLETRIAAIELFQSSGRGEKTGAQQADMERSRTRATMIAIFSLAIGLIGVISAIFSIVLHYVKP